MARIEVEAESLAAPDGIQRPLRGVDVVGDLRRMDFECEPHALLVEDVEDRVPALGEVLEAGVYLILRGRREEVELVPHGGAGATGDSSHTHLRRGPRRVLPLLGGAPPYPSGV